MAESDTIKAQIERESKLCETETTTRESHIDLRAIADLVNGHGRQTRTSAGRDSFQAGANIAHSPKGRDGARRLLRPGNSGEELF